MRVGVLIPSRGNERKDFLRNAIKTLDRQTVKPDEVVIMADAPVDEKCDITYRYRTGYKKFKNVDVIFFMEDDDWYHNQYIQFMLDKWVESGQPDLFGLSFTIYYHLKIRAYFKMQHATRASAMNTIIKPGLDIKWGSDNEAYTDITLWDVNRHLSRKVFIPHSIMCIGMKHGIGATGGKGHIDNLHRYINEDHGMHWLRYNVDAESYEFYSEMSLKLNS